MKKKADYNAAMNIVLKQKDADFILSFIRTDLKQLESSINKLDVKEQNLINSAKKLQDDAVVEIITQLTLEQGNVVKKSLKEIKDDLIRCVELLTVGSEVAE